MIAGWWRSRRGWLRKGEEAVKRIIPKKKRVMPKKKRAKWKICRSYTAELFNYKRCGSAPLTGQLKTDVIRGCA